MTFDEVLDQAIALLQRRGRLTYRALKRQFQLDDEALDDLKDELIYGQCLAVDEEDHVLVWTGESSSAPGTATASPPTRTSVPARAPLSYTPPHLTEKILTARAVLEGERKQVTVLFADLKDSTELIKDLDPEAAQQLLDPALHRMMDAVHRYEGTVNQVLGDGIMALFGAPVAHEDHALRACYAALAMQAALREHTDEVRHTHGLEMRLRVGLNAGEVVVRTISNDLHMDYSAVGHTTHLAARMEQMATPGTIRLTAATLRLVEGLVQVTALGPLPVKGLTEPVEAFELTGVTALRRRFQVTAARGLTHFVGRQAEMDALRQALQRASTGHGQVVAVVGEAGVGKSRLVYEFVRSYHTQGWLVLESASASYGKATPYFPVIDLLKRYAQVEAHNDARTIRAKVTGQVLTLDEQLQDTLPALLALLDVLPDASPFRALDPQQRRQRTLDAFKRLLLRESQVQPLLLVFEDLHWIDSETHTLLDSLVESLPAVPLLLLVNYRPEVEHSWGRKTYYTQVPLDPLPPVSVDALLRALLGDDPSLASLTPLLIARTEGNPFFLEECVRTLVETGGLVGEPGAYRLARALPSVQVPATVQAVLAARIDRLPPEDKHLLQTAAVISHEVPLPLLQAIAELPEAALHRGLAHLQASEFLYETRLFPEREFTFKHALTHEVAYSSLLQERRRVLHARIVEALEGLYPDRLAEQADRLAQHAFRGQVWDKALLYYQQAGTKAFAESAYREAVVCCEQALEALDHLPTDRTTMEQTIDLRCDLKHALELSGLGQRERILTNLRVAETVAEQLADQRRLGYVYLLTAVALRLMQDYEPALVYFQRTLTLATTRGDIDLQIGANLYQNYVYQDLGDYRRAMHGYQECMMALQGERLFQFLGHSTLPALQARGRMILCLTVIGEFVTGVALGDEALQIAEVLDRPYERVLVHSRVGTLHVRQGSLYKAIPLLERAVSLSQDANLRGLYFSSAPSLALAYAMAGRVTEALSVLRPVVGNLDVYSLPNAAEVVYSLPNTAEAYLRAGDVEEAHRLAQRGLTDARHHKMRGLEARALWVLGEVVMRRDPLAVEPAET